LNPIPQMPGSFSASRREGFLAEPFIAAVAAMRAVHDKSINLERYERFVREAAVAGAHLLVLPEASLQGFLFYDDRCFHQDEVAYHWENAEPVPGPSTAVIAGWAAEHDLWIVFGMMERQEHPAAPVLHNSAVLVGPQGVAGIYRKVHQPSEEVYLYEPGTEWPVFPTPFGTVGMMICYDQCFPEAARELTLRGAELLVLPTAWARSDRGSDDRYTFFGRARAAENGRWLLQSNQVGRSPSGDFAYLGCSRIIDPSGLVVAQSDAEEEGLLVCAVEPIKIDPARIRTGWYLHHRAPATYRALRGSKE
jgi:predicted amidohydrolase